MTAYSGDALGMVSRRSFSLLAASRTSGGSLAAAIFFSISCPSICCWSFSPSSWRMAFICSRRKNSRWVLAKVSLTLCWISVPMRSTSSSRLSSVVSRFRRDLTRYSSSSAWRSSSDMLRCDAIRSVSAPGPSTLNTAIFSSSGSVGREGDDFLELLGRVARQGHGLDRILDLVLEDRVVGLQEVRVPVRPRQAAARDALHEDAQGFVGKLEHLDQPRHAAELVQVREPDGVVRRRPVALEHGDQEARPGRHGVDQPHGLGGADHERRDHGREEDQVAHRQHGQHGRNRVGEARRSATSGGGGAGGGAALDSGASLMARIPSSRRSSARSIPGRAAAGWSGSRSASRARVCSPSTANGSSIPRRNGPYSISIWRNR